MDMQVQMQIIHERMEALRTAYADRVITAERRAIRAEKELESSKEESLFMFTRLKQLLDMKTKEAEQAQAKLSSLQVKNEELEAQLNEAEQITVDLRSELQQAHKNLEWANQKHVLIKKDFLDVFRNHNMTREVEIDSDLGGVSASVQRPDVPGSRDVESTDQMLALEYMQKGTTPEKYSNGCETGTSSLNGLCNGDVPMVCPAITQMVCATGTSPLKSQTLIVLDSDENDEELNRSDHHNNQSAADNLNTKNAIEPISRRRKRKSLFGAPKRFTAETCASQSNTNANEAVVITTGSNKVNSQHGPEENENRKMKSLDTLAPFSNSPPHSLTKAYPRFSILAHCSGNHTAKSDEETNIQEQNGSSAKLALTNSSSVEAAAGGDGIIMSTEKRQRKKKVMADFLVETETYKKRPYKRRAVAKEPVPGAAAESSRTSARESREMLEVAHELLLLSNGRE